MSLLLGRTTGCGRFVSHPRWHQGNPVGDGHSRDFRVDVPLLWTEVFVSILAQSTPGSTDEVVHQDNLSRGWLPGVRNVSNPPFLGEHHAEHGHHRRIGVLP